MKVPSTNDDDTFNSVQLESSIGLFLNVSGVGSAGADDDGVGGRRNWQLDNEIVVFFGMDHAQYSQTGFADIFTLAHNLEEDISKEKVIELNK